MIGHMCSFNSLSRLIETQNVILKIAVVDIDQEEELVQLRQYNVSTADLASNTIDVQVMLGGRVYDA